MPKLEDRPYDPYRPRRLIVTEGERFDMAMDKIAQEQAERKAKREARKLSFLWVEEQADD